MCIGASGANAAFGRYTGIDHGGAYADAGALRRVPKRGRLIRRLRARAARARLARRLCRRRPRGSLRSARELRGPADDLYDTGATPYKANGSNLGLPPGLGGGGRHRRHERARCESRTRQHRIGSSHRRIARPLLRESRAGQCSASFVVRSTMAAAHRRKLPDRSRAIGAAVRLRHNSFETGAAWAGRKASCPPELTGSWFEDDYDSITFANPYLPIVPGSTHGQLATPPGNTLQQVSAAGNVQLPWPQLDFTASSARSSKMPHSCR